MANLKIIWTTGRPFSPASIEKIGYQISSDEFNIYIGSFWTNQSSSLGKGYRPATAEEIAEHWKVLHPMWTPEPGDKVIITQDHYDWHNKRAVIVEKHSYEDYWRIKKEDGEATVFSKSTHMILAPYEETAKPVETPKAPESRHGFTIGDIVIPDCDNFKGRECIVKAFGSASVGVHCPLGSGLGGHTLDGHCPDHTGRWYLPSQLKLVSKEEPEEPMDLTKIIPGVGSFKVGDKVVAHSKIFKGCTGTIVRILSEEQPPLGVQFGEYHSHGHTLDGNCPIGYGWYYDKSDLTLVVEDKALTKPSTPSTPTIPPPKEGYVTVRIFTQEEFKSKDLWDTFGSRGCPRGWNTDGYMNQYLGTYILIRKSDFKADHSFNYEDWHFRVTDYEVIRESVEPKLEPKVEPEPEMKAKRFKVGDEVTYKSRPECSSGGYQFGGKNQGGYVGTIISYRGYYSNRNCYEITVTSKEGGIYNMLECEFYEYDGTYPGAVTLGTSTGSNLRVISSGTTDTPYIQTSGVLDYRPPVIKEDNLAKYNQAPVTLHKKPKRKLIIVNTY